MIPKGFRLNGLRFDARQQRLPKITADLLALLDKLPNGELLDSRSVAAALERSADHLTSAATHPALADYRELINMGGQRTNCRVFGNRKTIAQLRKKLHEDS